MCIYLHRQLANTLKVWGGWHRMAFFTLKVQFVILIVTNVTRFHFMAECWQKRGAGGEAGSPPLHRGGSPQEPALSTQADLPSSASTGTLPQGLTLQLLGPPCL